MTAPLEIRLVPSFKGRPDTLRNVANHEFRINDTVYVVAANHSSVSLFFNIIDIQPDGFINPIFPNINKRIYPSDLKIQPGQTFIFSDYPIRILPPVGNEIFKVFVSRSEINLEEIANSGGKTNRGNLSRLEDIFSKTYTTVNRGGEVMNKSGGDGSMYNILFRIKP